MIGEKKLNRLLTALLILLVIFIWGNSCLTVERSDALSRWILEHIFGSSPTDDGFSHGNHLLRKAAHITEFMLLSSLFCLRFRRRRYFWAYGFIAFAAAAADETIQIFTGRGSQLRDVLIDCSGASAGIIIMYFILRKKR